MCGIAGYLGPRPAIDIVFDQLKRLEYRGYDSAGIAFETGNEIKVIKRAGKLAQLGEALHTVPRDTHCAMGHSRWATHGGPTDENAHPHFDFHEDLALIHNGIIENYRELKRDLVVQGHHFESQTDTEVAAHIIGTEYQSGIPLQEAVRRGVKKLNGAYALVLISKQEPGTLIATRNASPLIIGIGAGETFLASDIPALLPFTREVVILEPGVIARITASEIEMVDSEGRPVEWNPVHIDWSVESAEKGGFDHFMAKEIHEQPAVIAQALLGRVDNRHKVHLDGVFSDHVWSDIDRVNIVACGTAYHAGLMGKHLFEQVLRLPTDVYFSSEFRYGDPVLSPKSLAIFVSQSGETADTIAALRLCHERRIRTLGIVNVFGSTLSRECDRTLFTQAGPEISVASTKAYTAQVLVLTLLALHIAQVKEMPGVRTETWTKTLQDLPKFAERVLALETEVIELVDQIKGKKLAFFLGRRADASVAMEGALKLKEVAYIPTQESPAGEMKHGPLALIDSSVVAFFGATDSSVFEKVVSNIKEVQARNGTVVAITSTAMPDISDVANHQIRFATTGVEFLDAILSGIVYQLIAYHWAKVLGCEIDQPRNLAKSVTVE